jgi:hypothetical protein
MRGARGGHQRADDRSAETWLRDSNDPDLKAVIQALVRKGLLVENQTDGRVPAPPSVEAAVNCLVTVSDKLQPKISPAHVWHFIGASANASKDLRWGSIEQTVRKVETRRIDCTHHTTAADNGLITELYGVFQTLRPYYPRRYLCLFDSLALLHFLARYGIFPQWVYGVRLEPFNAHCWVQTGDLVINDIVDIVRDYTPIMSI